MKRILPLTFALLLSFSLNAQTSLTEAVNFKSTAHGGEEIDLFEILDNGQYVLLDFFFYARDSIFYLFTPTINYYFIGFISFVKIFFNCPF